MGLDGRLEQTRDFYKWLEREEDKYKGGDILLIDEKRREVLFVGWNYEQIFKEIRKRGLTQGYSVHYVTRGMDFCG